jgi:hypothetical protein
MGRQACGAHAQYTHTAPVNARCGQRCGLHITATTATPDAERTGLVRKKGDSRSRYSSGSAAINSISLGMLDKPCFEAKSCFSFAMLQRARVRSAASSVEVISARHAARAAPPPPPTPTLLPPSPGEALTSIAS